MMRGVGRAGTAAGDSERGVDVDASSRLWGLGLPFVAFAISWAASLTLAADAESIRKVFRDPPREFSTAPLWVWNDDLTESQVRESLRGLKRQNVRQAFVHPRPGLMTPYLGDAWMQLWRAALDEAQRLDMNLWIYDENSYPSGFAGGHVPEVMPESRGRGLVLREVPKPPAWTDQLLGVYRLSGDGFENVTTDVREGKTPPDGRYLVAEIARALQRPWFGGRTYVDLLHPGVMERFLDITLEPYRRAFGGQFGGRVPGVFTDEPELVPAAGLPWTDDVPQRFEERWGYSLIDHLPGLHARVGDWKRVRHNYFQLLNDLFVARWGKPYHDYCERYNLEFTGHYWEHEWPRCTHVPDNMAMYAWHQRPAIDTLMNQYSEDPHAQFGNVRAVKELASVANQLGRRRTLCEAYGAGGWDLRFEDMKRIGDWLFVLGVNTLDEHLSYISIRGARKRDHPQSFSYHEPWWDAYHEVATYFTRLSAALSQGEEVNRVLVIEPTTTAWMYNSGDGSDPDLEKLGESFQKFVTELARHQIEFDIGSEDLIARHGSVAGGAFVVGERAYATVVLPAMTENLNRQTFELLERYVNEKGVVLCCGDPPALADGRPSDRGSTLSKQSGWRSCGESDLVVQLRARDPIATDAKLGRFEIGMAGDDNGILYHYRRRLDDGQLVFLVNTSIASPSAGHITCDRAAVEEWDPAAGRIEPYRAVSPATDGEHMTIAYDLPPCGSLLLHIGKANATTLLPASNPAPTKEQSSVIAASSTLEITRVGPNVLTLDYVDVTAGGETHRNMYVLKAAEHVFRQHGLERNPWDRAVQFEDELIRRTFPDGSGFEATYRFMIERRVPESLAIVIESADRYTITCNGQPVTPESGAWWLDKAFGCVPIASAARVGENAVTIKASPMTMYHELESAYVIGDFALTPKESGFAIAPPTPLALGAWNEQGLPFYAVGVSYRQSLDVAQPAGRYVITLPAWYGSVARVSVNGKPAGAIWHRPWQCDVTAAISPGVNAIEVVVIGTLKNTLGPHHGDPQLGLAWPAMWDKASEHGPPPGAEYATVGYGLFKPFVLENVRR